MKLIYEPNKQFQDDDFFNYVDQLQAAQKKYHGIIFYVPPKIPLVDDGVRTQSNAGRAMQDALLLGWYHISGLVLREIKSHTPEGRVYEIMDVLGYDV